MHVTAYKYKQICITTIIESMSLTDVYINVSATFNMTQFLCCFVVII